MVLVIMLGWLSVSALGQTIIYTFEGTLQISPLDDDGFDGAGLVGAAVSARIEADANASPIDIKRLETARRDLLDLSSHKTA